ncbi:MAG: hypothetical protein ACXWFI_06880 [Methylobacter sp.]
MPIIEISPDNNMTEENLLSLREIMHALKLMLHRMDSMNADCMNGYPLYSPGITDRWTVSPGGSWVGGFWAGCWWLRARLTGSKADRHRASAIGQRLYGKLSADSINRSMLFWYGAALGDLGFNDANARKLAKEATAALAASYDPKMQCIPLGPDIGGGATGRQHITIDTLAPVSQLFSRYADNKQEYIARSHTDTLLAVCRTGKAAFYAAADYQRGNFIPTGQAGDWSRGQAWAMLGLSRAAACWGEPYLSHALSACEYWRDSRSQWPVPNQLRYPLRLCDPSSTVIASLAMLAIADLIADGEQWRTCAHSQITALVRGKYFVELRKKNDRDSQAIFWGCCYKTGQDKDELVESAWGNFLLMSALSILAGAIKPDEC